MGLIPEMQRFFSIYKPINVIYHNNKLKNKNHMIVFIDTEKSSDIIQHLFMIKKKKNSSKSGHRRNTPQHKKRPYTINPQLTS